MKRKTNEWLCMNYLPDLGSFSDISDKKMGKLLYDEQMEGNKKYEVFDVSRISISLG